MFKSFANAATRFELAYNDEPLKERALEANFTPLENTHTSATLSSGPPLTVFVVSIVSDDAAMPSLEVVNKLKS